MAKALSAGFHRAAHRALPLPVGFGARAGRYRHLRPSAPWVDGPGPDRLPVAGIDGFNGVVLLPDNSILASAATAGLASVWGKMHTSALVGKPFMFDIASMMPNYGRLMEPLGLSRGAAVVLSL